MLERLSLALLITVSVMIAANAQSVGGIPGFFGGAHSIGTPQSLGTSSASTTTMTTSAAIQSGDLVVVCTSGEISAGTVTGISDGTNSYSLATSFTVGTVEPSTMWYKANAAAVSSGATITMTHSGSLSQNIMTAWRVSGIQSSPLDKTAANGTGSAGTTTATTAALSQANEIAAGCSGGAAGSGLSYSGAAGFTNLAAKVIGLFGTAGDYKALSSTSAVSFSPVWASGSLATALVATFKGN